MAETDAGARPPGDESEKGSFKKKDLVAMGGVAAFPDQSKQFTKDLRSRLSARTGNSIPLPDSSDDEDVAPAAPPDAAAAPAEGAAAASVQFAEPAASVDASADAASLPAQQQSQDLPGPSAAPGTLEFNNQLSMRLKELEGRARMESRDRAGSSFVVVDSQRASIDARAENATGALESLSFSSIGGGGAPEEAPPAPAPEPEPVAPAPPPRQLPRMSVREARAETTKVQAAIANMDIRVEGLRSANTALRKRAGLTPEGAPAAAGSLVKEELRRPGLVKAKTKDAMQMQVLELMDRQAALEIEAKTLEEQNHHLKKRVEEQEDEASLLAEVHKQRTDSFSHGAAAIAASGKALAYGGVAQEAPAREVQISVPPTTGKRSSGAEPTTGKRSSGAGLLGKRQSDSGPPPGAKPVPPAPEVEMTSRLSDPHMAQSGVPASAPAPAPAAVFSAAPAPAAAPPVASRSSGGRGSTGDRSSGSAAGDRSAPEARRSSGERQAPSRREDAQPLRGDPTPDPPRSLCQKCCVVS